VKSLDETLTHLDQATQALEPQLQALIGSLRETAAATQRTAEAASGALGASHGNIDLPGLMRELNDAARAIRELADYLDRHPEALLRGRRGD
jgi:paraquat-inducible protein B